MFDVYYAETFHLIFHNIHIILLSYVSYLTN